MKNTCVKGCDPVACTYDEPLCDEVGAQFYLLSVFLMSGGRGRAMVFSYQSIPPRSMRVVLWFLMTYKFVQQVYEFF